MTGYDQWKLATPPRLEDDGTAWCACGAEATVFRGDVPQCSRCAKANAEQIECPACGEIVDELDDDYKVCSGCLKSGGWVVGVRNVNSGESHPPSEPDPDDDRADDDDPEATPTITGDDPDEGELPEPAKEAR